MRLSMFVLLGLVLGTSPLVEFSAPTWSPPDAVARRAAPSISGRVIDAETQRPLAGTQVFVENSGMGALTGADGRYTILVTNPELAGTEVHVIATLIGYTQAQVAVRLGDEAVTADFALEQTAIQLDEVVVSGTGTAGRKRSLGNTVGTIRAGATSAPPRATPAPPRATPTPPRATPAPARANPAPARYPNVASPLPSNESYAAIEDNEFKSPYKAPLSTFSIDVDRASYSNVRRFITNGQRPPPDAVRIEEMVNYFSYNYPDPVDEGPFSINTEVWEAPWAPSHRLVRVGIQGVRMNLQDLPPANLVFLLDVSGSMASHDKLPLVQRSLRMLVDELRPHDRVAIVVYAGAAGLVLPSTPAVNREVILESIGRLSAGGSTAGGAGIELAYRVASQNQIRGGNNRVILATDGDFNVGASSDAAMEELIEREREEGTFLTVLGFGTGNLQDSKMETLADHGNGNYAYIDGLLEARKVLVNEMGGTLTTIAKDVKIQVEFNPDRVAAYRLIGYENRLLADEDFNDDRKDAGELGAGHSVTALYEVVPSRSEEHGNIDPLRYQASERRSDVREERPGELLFVKLRYKSPDGDRSRLIETAVSDRVGSGSVDLRFAASVAAFGMLLRDSEHSGDFQLRDVERLARGALGEDENGYRSEFVRLVEATSSAQLVASAR